MDRSSLRRVETTSDSDKRQAFKNRLAKSVEPSTGLTSTVPISAGFPAGATVWHPDLGPCTIFSIDKKSNSIILESPSLGRIDLILSQVEARLVPIDDDGGPAYVDKFSPPFVEPTLIDASEAFSPTNWHRADQPTIYTERKQPKKKEATRPVAGHLPVGSTVWHPDFGACTVSLIDVKANTIVLDFATFGSLDMVLSQVEMKLLPIRRDAPSHVGKAPRSNQPTHSSEPETPSPSPSVVLPPVFRTWKPLEQFTYLTREKHFTTEEANEFIAALSGRFEITPVFKIRWDEVLDRDKKVVFKQTLSDRLTKTPVVEPVAASVDTTPQPLSEILSLSVTLPSSFRTFPVSGQYTFLTKTKHLTPEEANDVIAVHGGTAPRNDKVRFEILWDDQVGVSEFGVHRTLKELEAKAKVQASTVREVLDLPLVFKTWKPVEQYQYLTTNKHLTSLAANNVIEAVLYAFPCDFDLVWGELAETDKRAAYKDNLLKKVGESLSKKAIEPIRPVDTAPQPLSEVLSLSVTLPSIFKSLQASGQYVFLTKTKHLTPDEANDVIAIYRDTTPRNPKVQFEILWDDHDGLSEFGVRRVLKKPKVKVDVPMVREVLDLPQVFKTWKPVEQYQYLTANKHLTSLAANNVIEAVLYNFTCDFDLIWDELPETKKRLAYKENLLKKVEAAFVVKPEPLPVTLPAAITHLGVQRTMVDTEVTKKVITPGLQRLSVTVPHEFKTWNASDQYTFFTKTKKLTPNEANDLISVYNGDRPHDSKTQYEFVWDTLSVGLDPSQVSRSTDPVETEKRETVSQLQKLSVTLPQAYKKWRPADQFSFLAHTKRLSNEEANDIVALLRGEPTHNTKTIFEIIWDDK